MSLVQYTSIHVYQLALFMYVLFILTAILTCMCYSVNICACAFPAATMVEVGQDKNNPDEFAMALDETLGDFAFPDEFVFDVWGAIGDAKQGRF